MNNYDRIAGIYDLMATVIFFGAISEAKKHYMSLVASKSKILLVGGGTGKILKHLNQLNIPITVDFLEPSFKMITKAKERADGLPNLHINYIQNKLDSFESAGQYDCICSFFFLDIFQKSDLIDSVKKFSKMLSTNGFLLVSDFQIKNNLWWQKALSGLMHVFFRITTNLQSKGLKDINSYLCKSHFINIDRTQFFNGFIFSAVYEKKVS